MPAATVDSLFDTLVALEADRRRPPVAGWHPAHRGRIDIRIGADGTWYHEGDPFRRTSLVRLFASILRRDADGYWLVTPAEQLRIEVDDAPFVAVDLEVKGAGREQSLLFVTNVDDVVVADAAHPLRMAGDGAAPRPYVMVRDGLEALIARPVYYRLIEHAVEEGADVVAYSRGTRFLLGRF